MEQIKCCGSCKHLYKKITSEPCLNCLYYNKWEINDNLKHEIEKKRGTK